MDVGSSCQNIQFDQTSGNGMIIKVGSGNIRAGIIAGFAAGKIKDISFFGDNHDPPGCGRRSLHTCTALNQPV
jgi:hypothetical protein